jgi:hypothetical protein
MLVFFAFSSFCSIVFGEERNELSFYNKVCLEWNNTDGLTCATTFRPVLLVG